MEQGSKESLPVIKSQKISLRVDASSRTLSGWTEISAEVDKNAKELRLHAYGLEVSSISISGISTAATFSHQPATVEDKLADLASASPGAGQLDLNHVAGDVARQQYQASLQAHLAPELKISLPEEALVEPNPPAPADQENGSPDPKVKKKASNRRTVTLKIEYSGVNPTAGVHFYNNYAVTDNEVRRASAWVPCVDIPDASVQFELRLTVPSDCMAIGPGQLTKQTWADKEQQWKTFHYKLGCECAPCDLGFAIGPFSALSGPTGDIPAANGAAPAAPPAITHFHPSPSTKPNTCTLQSSSGDMSHTSRFFALPFSLYCEILGNSFPFPSMQQVFLPSELARTDSGIFQGLQVLSVDTILQPRSVEQSQAARCAIAGALAQQWFGHFLRPATIDDAWLVEGIAGWLQDQFVKRYLGRTEVAYARWQRAQEVAAADDGDAPPLAYRLNSHAPPPVNSAWGPLFGTERLDASPFRSMKAAAVVAMLERRAGEELFRKHVETLVTNAMANPQARFVDSLAFMTELGRAGDFKKEVNVFIERWVYGRGAPTLVVGYRFYRRGCYLEVAIQQTGSEASKLSAQAAEIAAQREGFGTGVIKVSVREGSGATVDHPVHIGGEAAKVADIKVNPETKKVQLKRGRKRKDEEEQQAAALKAAENAMHPVQWVRIDPAGEWLCISRMSQTVRTLRNQLFDSKDVIAQIEAVRSLGEHQVSEVSYEALSLLQDALKNTHKDQTTHLHCRVRMAAAEALAGLKCESGKPLGLTVLTEYYKEKYFDSTDGEDTVKSTSFPDVGEYLVAQAVVKAIASVTRMPQWNRSPDAGDNILESIMFIKACADDYHSGWGAYDDSGLLAAICTAYGDLMAPAHEEGFVEIVSQLAVEHVRRRLAADLVAPSPGHIVGISCLKAMTKVVLSRKNIEPKVENAVRVCLLEYCNGKRVPMLLRVAAHKAYARFLAARKRWSAALEFALQCSEKLQPPGAVLARAAWEEVALLAAAAAAVSQPVPQPLLLRTALLVREFPDARVQHLAFSTLQRLAQQAPSLYIPQDDLVLFFPEPESAPVALLAGSAPIPLTMEGKVPLTRPLGPETSVQMSLEQSNKPLGLSGQIKLGKAVAGGPLMSGGGGATILSDGRASGPAMSEVDQVISSASPMAGAATGRVYSPVREAPVVGVGEEQSIAPVPPGTVVSSPVSGGAGPAAAAPPAALKVPVKIKLSAKPAIAPASAPAVAETVPAAAAAVAEIATETAAIAPAPASAPAEAPAPKKFKLKVVGAPKPPPSS